MRNLSSLLRSITFSNPYVFILFLGFAVGLALILVPLMFYHPLQLLVGSFIVGKFARADRHILRR
jgi:sodium/bile acid cotransporter 7